ncbi:MAG: methionine biosynthesis protein MetW [Chloroflexota bacterium]
MGIGIESRPAIHNSSRRRVDLGLIASLIEDNSTVLDLGCGDGELLDLLAKEKNARGTGIEIAEEKVYQCIARGVPVQHGDLDAGLADYADRSFDYVVLSQTLQAVRKPRLVLQEMLRVGRQGIVSFPNFGHWRVRWALLRTGRMPKAKHIPFEWYDTPNIHLSTVRDFEDLCRADSIRIRRAIFLANGDEVRLLHNLRAELAVFLVEKV